MLKFLIPLLISMTYLTASEIVNVYSHRHYPIDKKLYKQFYKQSGIKVNLIKASSAELIKRIQSEGKYTKADVLLTTDVGMLELARTKGLFQAIESTFLNQVIPSYLKHRENLWFGLTKRARIIAYHIDEVKKEELSTYQALGDKKWKKRIIVTKSTEVYNQSLLASYIVKHGEANATNWAKDIQHNMARRPTGTDKDSLRAVAAGLGDLAIANTYYIGQMKQSKRFSDKATAEVLGLFFPDQGTHEHGTHINISGAGVVKYAKHKENAIKFIEFLASVEAQEAFAKVNFEYPVNPQAKISPLLQSWGSFKEDKTSLDQIGAMNRDAMKIFHRVGWDK